MLKPAEKAIGELVHLSETLAEIELDEEMNESEEKDDI